MDVEELDRLASSLNARVSKLTWWNDCGVGSGMPYANCTKSQQKCLYNILTKIGNGEQSVACLVGGGGCGKTSTTLSLVSYLTKMGKKVATTNMSGAAA